MEEALESRRNAPPPKDVAEDLYTKFYDRVLHQVFLVIGNQDRAVEATQEAFLRAFERFDTLRDPTKFPSWVTSIAINAARDRLRERARETPSDTATFDARSGDSIDDGPEGQACTLDEAERLRDAIRKLPADFRAVVVLYYLHEENIASVARLLKIPEGTVKSRLFRARSALRRIIGLNREGPPGVSLTKVAGDFGDTGTQSGEENGLDG